MVKGAHLSRAGKARGFTLVELLIVLGLSMVGLLGLLSMQIAAQRGNMRSRNFTEAVALAQDKLEAIETTPLVSLAGGTENALGAFGLPADGGVTYTRTTTVNAAGATTTIRVQVSWIAEDGLSHSVTVNTVRSP